MVSIGKCLMRAGSIVIQTSPAGSSQLLLSAPATSALHGNILRMFKSSFSWSRSLVTRQHSYKLSSPMVVGLSSIDSGHNVRLQSSDSRTKMAKSYEPPSPYKNPGPRRYGYETKILTGGTLPRVEGSIQKLPIPTYEPKDFWTRKKALFGQNDYIDILGNGDIHPADLIKGPTWLVGFRGNELQRLIRRMHFQGAKMKWLYPTKYHQLRKRIWFLYKKYNQKRARGKGT